MLAERERIRLEEDQRNAAILIERERIRLEEERLIAARYEAQRAADAAAEASMQAKLLLDAERMAQHEAEERRRLQEIEDERQRQVALEEHHTNVQIAEVAAAAKTMEEERLREIADLQLGLNRPRASPTNAKRRQLPGWSPSMEDLALHNNNSSSVTPSDSPNHSRPHTPPPSSSSSSSSNIPTAPPPTPPTPRTKPSPGQRGFIGPVAPPRFLITSPTLLAGTSPNHSHITATPTRRLIGPLLPTPPSSPPPPLLHPPTSTLSPPPNLSAALHSPVSPVPMNGNGNGNHGSIGPQLPTSVSAPSGLHHQASGSSTSKYTPMAPSTPPPPLTSTASRQSQSQPRILSTPNGPSIARNGEDDDYVMVPPSKQKRSDSNVSNSSIGSASSLSSVPIPSGTTTLTTNNVTPSQVVASPQPSPAKTSTAKRFFGPLLPGSASSSSSSSSAPKPKLSKEEKEAAAKKEATNRAAAKLLAKEQKKAAAAKKLPSAKTASTTPQLDATKTAALQALAARTSVSPSAQRIGGRAVINTHSGNGLDDATLEGEHGMAAFWRQSSHHQLPTEQ
jgi:hypothetical protein